MRVRKFKQELPYPHLRSDGLTDRHNGGTRATTRKSSSSPPASSCEDSRMEASGTVETPESDHQ